MKKRIIAVLLAAVLAIPVVPVHAEDSYESTAPAQDMPVLEDLVKVSDDAIEISWKQASGATAYNIYRKKEGESWIQVGTASASDTSFTHEASDSAPFEEGAVYYYTVRAVNGEVLGKMDVNGLSIRMGGGETSPLEEEMNEVVDEFIDRVSTEDMSSQQKLKACWDHFMGNEFIPSMEPDVSQDGWQYQAAMDYITLDAGECAMLACAVAACAKRLGYSPYVYHVPYDHSFVIVDGMYWDNMNTVVPSDSPSREYSESDIFLF